MNEMAGTLVSSGSYSALKSGGASAQCFRVTYHSLEGYANLLGRKTEVGGARGHGCPRQPVVPIRSSIFTD